MGGTIVSGASFVPIRIHKLIENRMGSILVDGTTPRGGGVLTIKQGFLHVLAIS